MLLNIIMFIEHCWRVCLVHLLFSMSMSYVSHAPCLNIYTHNRTLKSILSYRNSVSKKTEEVFLKTEKKNSKTAWSKGRKYIESPKIQKFPNDTFKHIIFN